MDTIAFLVLYWLFSVGYLLVLTCRNVRKRLRKEWWIEIRSQGVKPTTDALMVGQQDQNHGMVIYGEPRTWCEQRLKEPKAQMVLAQMKEQKVLCTLTDRRIELTAPTFPLYRVEQWQCVLNENPPTSKDWRQSRSGCPIAARDKNALSTRTGAPIAISPLRNADRALQAEGHTNNKALDGLEPFYS